ncbi:hypothetical protein QAD02_009809 [Eretmocerus hayati]|uniref:Uncharacterized protein n=1 Tax=Eretmocerus hayati TaxID=131215 RepID=A0ACC2NB67_9HYME|nr:hypothetical protein QAD02_009809 [Eretmocerus hayati]
MSALRFLCSILRNDLATQGDELNAPTTLIAETPRSPYSIRQSRQSASSHAPPIIQSRSKVKSTICGSLHYAPLFIKLLLLVLKLCTPRFIAFTVGRDDEDLVDESADGEDVKDESTDGEDIADECDEESTSLLESSKRKKPIPKKARAINYTSDQMDFSD